MSSDKPKPVEVQHVILLVHGIRDEGAWDGTTSELSAAPDVVVMRIRYAKWSALRFILPYRYVAGPLKVVIDAYDGAKAQYPNAKISAIGHSFGTYLILKLLSDEPRFKLWKLVFCGSVTDDLMNWGNLEHKIGIPNTPKRGFIVNDCGTADKWPVLGSAMGWYYGMAGATGFNDVYVTNRFHRSSIKKGGGKHGVYFESGFATKYWRTFLFDNVLEKGDGRQGQDIPWYIKPLYYPVGRWSFRLCSWLAILAILLLVLWAMKWVGGSLYGLIPASPPISETYPEIVIARETALRSSSPDDVEANFTAKYKDRKVLLQGEVHRAVPSKKYLVLKLDDAGRSTVATRLKANEKEMDTVIDRNMANCTLTEFDQTLSEGAIVQVEGIVVHVGTTIVLKRCRIIKGSDRKSQPP